MGSSDSSNGERSATEICKIYGWARQEGYSVRESIAHCGVSKRVVFDALQLHWRDWVVDLPGVLTDSQCVQLLWGDLQGEMRIRCEILVNRVRHQKVGG